ncbi:MAG: DUF4282 domain-containing protein [Parafannyhessea sp.]|uniref:DUF4282 domain-containing protein n=1 Tax=Parafannyhessea sp. TaxID=2847324 RepID=UPI003EFD803F
MLYGYGYDSYSNPLTSWANFGGALGVLMLIAFIAAIVLTVMGYKRFISDKSDMHLSFSDKRSWGPFLRFDVLLIDKILKALYLFNSLMIAFGCLAVVLSSISFGVGAFLGTLVAMAIACILLELLCRVVNEFLILNIVIARNTSDIKRDLRGLKGERDAGMPVEGMGFDGAPVPPTAPASAAAAAVPVAPAPTSEPEPAPAAPEEAPAAPASQVEPVVEPEAEARVDAGTEPEATNEPDAEEAAPTTVLERPAEDDSESAQQEHVVRFCPNCGSPVGPNDRFCGECGQRLK